MNNLETYAYNTPPIESNLINTKLSKQENIVTHILSYLKDNDKSAALISNRSWNVIVGSEKVTRLKNSLNERMNDIINHPCIDLAEKEINDISRELIKHGWIEEAIKFTDHLSNNTEFYDNKRSSYFNPIFEILVSEGYMDKALEVLNIELTPSYKQGAFLTLFEAFIQQDKRDKALEVANTRPNKKEKDDALWFLAHALRNQGFREEADKVDAKRKEI